VDWQLLALLGLLLGGMLFTIGFAWWVYTRCEVGSDGEYVRRNRTVGDVWAVFMRTLRT
jgi:hypothetical protein